MKLKPFRTVSNGQRRRNHGLRRRQFLHFYQSHLAKNAFFFTSSPLIWKYRTSHFYAKWIFGLSFSLEQCALFYFQYGNIVTKEAQPWFAPTEEIFNFALPYLFKNAPISDWLAHKWDTWKSDGAMPPAQADDNDPVNFCPKTKEVPIKSVFFHIEKTNEIYPRFNHGLARGENFWILRCLDCWKNHELQDYFVKWNNL